MMICPDDNDTHKHIQKAVTAVARTASAVTAVTVKAVPGTEGAVSVLAESAVLAVPVVTAVTAAVTDKMVTVGTAVTVAAVVRVTAVPAVTDKTVTAGETAGTLVDQQAAAAPSRLTGQEGRRMRPNFPTEQLFTEGCGGGQRVGKVTAEVKVSQSGRSSQCERGAHQ